MSIMGLRNKNGQMITHFTCTSCKNTQLIDFRYYPICKKCKKINTKLQKRAEKKKKEENP